MRNDYFIFGHIDNEYRVVDKYDAHRTISDRGWLAARKVKKYSKYI